MDAKILPSVARLSNADLITRVKSLAQRERAATAALIVHLAELDKRRLYLAEGFSSLFTYCTRFLHLSEHAAYGRIEAARIVQRFPVILEMLEQGSLNLTTMCLLASQLTAENHREILDQAMHKSKRQIEELLASLHPQPDVPSTIRRLANVSRIIPSRLTDEGPRSSPQPSNQNKDEDAGTQHQSLPTLTSPQSRPALIVPLAPERYKLQFTVSAETYNKLRLAQNLLRHQIPDGDPAVIFDRAMTVLLEDLAKKKLAATDRPREGRDHTPASRRIPADVRRSVWLRDGGRCAFVAENGRRCTEEGFLEYHHVTPYASGGPPTVENIQLRCRAHNGYEAELMFGLRNPSVVREASATYKSLIEGPYLSSATDVIATRSGPSTAFSRWRNAC